MCFDSAYSFTCSQQDGLGVFFVGFFFSPMPLNNPAPADSGFGERRPADSLSSCPQGFASNRAEFERSSDSSFLTAVKSA